MLRKYILNSAPWHSDSGCSRFVDFRAEAAPSLASLPPEVDLEPGTLLR